MLFLKFYATTAKGLFNVQFRCKIIIKSFKPRGLVCFITINKIEISLQGTTFFSYDGHCFQTSSL